jgi:hypothetical protein
METLMGDVSHVNFFWLRRELSVMFMCFFKNLSHDNSGIDLNTVIANKNIMILKTLSRDNPGVVWNSVFLAAIHQFGRNLSRDNPGMVWTAYSWQQHISWEAPVPWQPWRGLKQRTPGSSTLFWKEPVPWQSWHGLKQRYPAGRMRLDGRQ